MNIQSKCQPLKKRGRVEGFAEQVPGSLIS
jgi:hypothetical protein